MEQCANNIRNIGKKNEIQKLINLIRIELKINQNDLTGSKHLPDVLKSNKKHFVKKQ